MAHADIADLKRRLENQKLDPIVDHGEIVVVAYDGDLKGQLRWAADDLELAYDIAMQALEACPASKVTINVTTQVTVKSDEVLQSRNAVGSE